jgi:hypothetical protein
MFSGRRFILSKESVARARESVFTILDGGQPVGTGFFVAPRLAITALHNLKSSNVGEKVRTYYS